MHRATEKVGCAFGSRIRGRAGPRAPGSGASRWLVAVALTFLAGSVGASTYQHGDWMLNFDNSIAYSLGARVEHQDPRILYHPAFYAGDEKFPDPGDIVTNRLSDLMEIQAVYKGQYGFRVSGTFFKDFAYTDREKIPEKIGDFYESLGLPASAACNYENCRYSGYTKRNFKQGAELLDAFAFANTEIGGHNVYLKAGRLTSYWGNAFFFGFSNIAYSQSPIDYIKGFTQPGSEVKELFLPRTQVSARVDLTPTASVEAQYFLEYASDRFPESGTYLGFFNPLYDGPERTSFVASGLVQGIQDAPDENANFGIKFSWRPEWAAGDLGFYYRQFDEVMPWNALVNPENQKLYDPVARKATLAGISYERTFGLINIGMEVSKRWDTALLSAALVESKAGATGELTNVIANTLVQLGQTPIWDTGILIAELSYTHLDAVTGNKDLYNGTKTANCVHVNSDGTVEPGNWKDGCATDNALAVALLFDPQWTQVFPGVDLDMPISYTYGISGNPAYAASAFYPEKTNIYSIGLKALIRQRHTLSLTYLGYHWRPNGVASPFGPDVPPSYSGFGGAGPVSLNDRGWLQLQLKTSF